MADHYRVACFSVKDAGWPGMDAEVEQLHRGSTRIAALTVERIVDHYDRTIRELPRPPIIMGHSFGGAFAQVLHDRERTHH